MFADGARNKRWPEMNERARRTEARSCVSNDNGFELNTIVESDQNLVPASRFELLTPRV